MENINIINRVREMARLCLECPYANTARQEQKGVAYKCAKNVPQAQCPFWDLYQAELRACDASRLSYVGGMVPAQVHGV
jgi:hypothetical protein